MIRLLGTRSRTAFLVEKYVFAREGALSTLFD
jgi:hypothetical protein